jgi:hypothetical protein
MPIVPMDPELVWRAIEGYSNELDPEQKKLEALYRQFSCPRCDGPWQKEILSAKHAFADKDTLVPRAVLRCRICRCLFNPHVLDSTGVPMILELGNPAKALPDIPILGK